MVGEGERKVEIKKRNPIHDNNNQVNQSSIRHQNVEANPRKQGTKERNRHDKRCREQEKEKVQFRGRGPPHPRFTTCVVLPCRQFIEHEDAQLEGSVSHHGWRRERGGYYGLPGAVRVFMMRFVMTGRIKV